MRIDANGIAFNLRLDGRPHDDETAPWLAFGNSLATDLTLWDGQVARFGDRFRILRYDTRGHGGTEASDPPYAFELLCADALALMDAVGIDRAHWVGLSLGGSTGLGLALDHADRLASLAVCDSRPHSDPAFFRAWDDRIATIEADGMEGAVESTIERWFTEPFRSGAGRAVCDRVRTMIRATAPAGFIGCSRALQTLDYAARLAEIALPALFMAGESDRSCPPAIARAMHESVAGSLCTIVAPGSHISNLENPAQFDAGLERHFARLG
jgi:3-oxoadipate enol-lactonase